MRTLSANIQTVPVYSSQTFLGEPLTLSWRQNKLIVSQSEDLPASAVPSNFQRLVSCLQRSPVALVKLDPTLSETQLRHWADACQQAGKAAFLRLPAASALPYRRARLFWWVKCVIDRIAALLLLLLLSPLMAALAVAIVLTSPGPVFFRQWRVGKRGKLFRIFKFRTMSVDAERLHYQLMGHQTGLHKLENDPRITPIGFWLRRYSLDELPQLLNVLRGEMSLVGPRPWALYDAVRICPTLRHRLNALPGITGMWQVKMRSHLRDLDVVNRCDLDYLRDWSPLQDFKILLLTIPKVISGFGAF